MRYRRISAREKRHKSNVCYNTDGIYITRHALLRYMQRYHKTNEQTAKEELTSYVAKSSLISLMTKDGIPFEKRIYHQKGIFFICKTSINKNTGQRVLTVVTITMARTAQLEHFATTVDDIDYIAMGNSKAIKNNYDGGINEKRFK